MNFQPGNLAYIDDMELELLQFHFHAPSEHAMDGKRYAMEVHLVHRNKATGEPNACLHVTHSKLQRSFDGALTSPPEHLQATWPCWASCWSPADW